MGLNTTNRFEKTVGHLNILDAIQAAKGNIKGLEERLEGAPLQAEGRASLPKMPRAWGIRACRRHSSCLLFCSVLSKQVTTAALQKTMSGCDEMASSTPGERPAKCWLH